MNDQNKNNSIQAASDQRLTKSWHIHRRLYNWVIHWADTKFGVLALVILAVTEPICVPIPADCLVIGLCLGKPKNSIRYGLTCAFFSVLGGTIAFSLGLLIGGERIINFFEWFSNFFGWVTFGLFNPDLANLTQKALELYDKHDFWAIAISALTPVPYMIFSWVGGMAGVSLAKFIAVSAVFRTMRFGGEALIFYFLGQKARRIIEKYFNIATVIVIILLMILVYLMKLLSRLF